MRKTLPRAELCRVWDGVKLGQSGIVELRSDASHLHSGREKSQHYHPVRSQFAAGRMAQSTERQLAIEQDACREALA